MQLLTECGYAAADPATATAFALRDIEVSEELFISYVDTSLPVEGVAVNTQPPTDDQCVHNCVRPPK